MQVVFFLYRMLLIFLKVWLTLFAFLQYECVRTEDRLPRLDRADRIGPSTSDMLEEYPETLQPLCLHRCSFVA
jgi:hypothetical protein